MIFDCNVYLDVAELLGEPFTWAAFDQKVAQLAKTPVPSTNQFEDSLRAIAVCRTGRFAGRESLEVWTSEHIDETVHAKCTHPVIAEIRTGYQGLGWSPETAQSLVSDLIHTLVETTGGDTTGAIFPDGDPPLDHEDGLVYGTCRHVVNVDALARVYCVTNDGGFLTAYNEGRLPNHTVVLSPTRFLLLVRAARAGMAARRITHAG
ncbi:hypothetical protein [Microbacterium sp. As-52]|uniref:hypothetical protein n=1 Tax=Microbacterium sp. As-52 TaxID=3390503 RepID=UPI003CEB74AA